MMANEAARMRWVRRFTGFSGRMRTRRSEDGTNLELEALDSVERLVVERVRVAELERPDGRIPRDTHACRVAERLERILLAFRRLLPVRVDLAGIEEHARAHGFVALQDRIEEQIGRASCR